MASLEAEEGDSVYDLFPENKPAPVIASFASELKIKSGEEEAAGEPAQTSPSEEGGRGAGKSPFTGTEYGTAVHRLLELFDYGRFPEPASVSEGAFCTWREELAASGRIPQTYARDLPAAGILAFLRSGLAARMAAASGRAQLFREQPFVLGIEADAVNPAFPHEEIMLIQGIIDAYFEEDGELILVDYKTDRVEAAQELRDRYQIQLDLYERALEQITGKKVREKLIYSVSLRETISL